MYNENMNQTRVYVEGVMTVLYFGRMIALVNSMGEVIWREEIFPIFLIEYLIEYHPPSYESARWN